MKTLHLTLKKKWFDMIAAGIKKEEYREIKTFWSRRLNHKFTHVCFSNGYGPDVPKMTFELKEILRGLGIIEWGAPEGEMVYIVRLGEQIKEVAACQK